VDVVDVSYEDRSSLFSAAGGSVRQIAVNAGSHYQYVDAGGMVWEADRPYSRGSWGYVGGEARLRHHRIYGSDDDALYQAERVGIQEYRFDVPNGTYDVRLLFVEQEYDRAGQRVFDAGVNGQLAFRRLDLAGAHGRYNAVDRTIVATALDGKGITVQLQPVIGKATISGIMLRAH
jgi:beta-galactosidase